MAVLRRRTNSIKKTNFTLIGGPYDGMKIPLSSASTLTFRVPSFDKRAGRYVLGDAPNTLQWEFI